MSITPSATLRQTYSSPLHQKTAAVRLTPSAAAEAAPASRSGWTANMEMYLGGAGLRLLEKQEHVAFLSTADGEAVSTESVAVTGGAVVISAAIDAPTPASEPLVAAVCRHQLSSRASAARHWRSLWHRMLRRPSLVLYAIVAAKPKQSADCNIQLVYVCVCLGDGVDRGRTSTDGRWRLWENGGGE
ncbi:chromosomal replication initiator protein DnaA [Striga asiatica]|uniref:Chromosomal replication initiator protein DnaA n=1 Tax=Striga asiatica TaxID=4170 RepID=A0A5A7Q7K2_STRAF|nr:chromosomal replication initiator protein DnaA [Striga asiatica]